MTGPAPAVISTLFSGNQIGRFSISGGNVAEGASDAYGTLASLGHNLLETSANVNGLASSDIIDIPALVGPLADNAGLTRTHALLANSPALDAADPNAPPTDQRSESRPQGLGVDIGAYELSALALRLDGELELPGSFSRDISAVLTLESPYPTGAILYTLDGSTPTLSSTPYSGPVTLTQSATIRAIAYDPSFSAIGFAGPVDLTIIPGRNLTLTTIGQGSVAANPPNGPYVTGTVVTLTPQPAAGWRFQGWSGDLSGNSSPATITMDANKSVQATFVQIPTYSLSLTTFGQGSVEVSPASGRYLEGSSVTLRAQPEEGWGFAGWSGDVSGAQNPLMLTMDATKSVQATFRRIVSFSAATAGGGSITLAPEAGPYLQGDSVTATAQPHRGWQFLYWRGELESTESTIHFALAGNTKIEAVFGTTATFNAVGGGSVVAQPTAAIYPYGSTIRLTGIPAAGQRFSFWSAPVDSQSNPVNVTITQPSLTVSGVFVPLEANQAALTVLIEGGGSVANNPAGNFFPIGTSIQLTAAAAEGYQFVGWSGDVNASDNPLTLVLDSSQVITAHFIPAPTISVIFTTNDNVPGEGAGTRFASFTSPAINDAGDVAFLTSIEGLGFQRPAIFARDRIIAQKGSAAPDAVGNANLLYFSKLLDPVIDERGHVAFIATAAEINGRNPRMGIWSDVDGSTLKLIALQGGDAAGAASGRFAKFKSISLQDGQMLISATLMKGAGINSGNDHGVWTWTPDSGLKLQLREGVTKVNTTAGACQWKFGSSAGISARKVFNGITPFRSLTDAGSR